MHIALSTWRARICPPWVLFAAFLITALFLFAFPEQARAQDASCGEPQRRQGAIVLERCAKRVFNIDGHEKKVVVYFTTTNGSPRDRLSAVDADGNPSNGAEFNADAVAGFIADKTVDVWRIYRTYGFPDPGGRSDQIVHVWDRPTLGWCCTADGQYEVSAPHAVDSLRFGGNPRDLEATIYHEMGHASLFGRLALWAVEGGASHMTDHVTLPLDNDNQSDYMFRLWGYLTAGGHRASLVVHDYDAALWWQYFSERTSGGTDPVRRGVDAIKAFWFDTAGTAFARMDNVIRARLPGETFESIWIDFAVANYAKELTSPHVPSKYHYVDELQAGAPDYPPPALDGVFRLEPGSSVLPTLVDVNTWSAKYFQFTPSESTPFINIEVRQELNRRLAYCLLIIDDNEIVREERSIGRNFSRSFANNGYDRVVLVVVGLNERADFRYSVNAPMALDIVDPLQSRPVTVGGPHARERMLVKVNVFAGPGGEPITGIAPNSFSITVGAMPVRPDDIVAAYIQGQYWLLVRAPEQAAAGVYDLIVSYAGVTDTETAAVQYEDRTAASTVVVIDRSRSMLDYGSIQAAKDAARLYINSWRDGDQIGVVSFSGDAIPDLPLGPFSTQRGAAIHAIADLVPAGATSIGDGAQVAMQELTRDSSSREWSEMLLSDGMETEPISIADFLTNYNARLNATPPQKVPRVSTVALGPEADRGVWSTWLRPRAAAISWRACLLVWSQPAQMLRRLPRYPTTSPKSTALLASSSPASSRSASIGGPSTPHPLHDLFRFK